MSPCSQHNVTSPATLSCRQQEGRSHLRYRAVLACSRLHLPAGGVSNDSHSWFAMKNGSHVLSQRPAIPIVNPDYTEHPDLPPASLVCPVSPFSRLDPSLQGELVCCLGCLCLSQDTSDDSHALSYINASALRGYSMQDLWQTKNAETFQAGPSLVQGSYSQSCPSPHHLPRAPAWMETLFPPPHP